MRYVKGAFPTDLDKAELFITWEKSQQAGGMRYIRNELAERFKGSGVQYTSTEKIKRSIFSTMNLKKPW